MSNFNFNRVTIGGRITKKPEVIAIANSETSVCNFTVAVTRSSKIEGQPDSDFFNCTAFNKTADFIAKYFDKGSAIMIEGRLQQRSYINRDNQRTYVTEIIVSNAYFVDSKTDRKDSSTYVPQAYGAPSFTSEVPNFEEVKTDEDLPF